MKQCRIELDCQLILFYEREDSECSKAFKISRKRFKAPASILNSFLRLLSFLALRLCNVFEEEREEVEEAFKNATLSPSTREHLRNRSSRSPRRSAARTRAPRRASERRAAEPSKADSASKLFSMLSMSTSRDFVFAQKCALATSPAKERLWKRRRSLRLVRRKEEGVASSSSFSSSVGVVDFILVVNGFVENIVRVFVTIHE